MSYDSSRSHATDETRSTRSSVVVNCSVMPYSIQYSIFGAISSYVDELREQSKLQIFAARTGWRL
jgi:hypothetical protein